jgi:hypothetical protein
MVNYMKSTQEGGITISLKEISQFIYTCTDSQTLMNLNYVCINSNGNTNKLYVLLNSHKVDNYLCFRKITKN